MDFLAEQYIEGKQTYTMEEGEKVVSDIVYKTMYSLFPEAMELFERMHDECELEICQKYPNDVLIRGRGYYLKTSPHPWIYMIEPNISFFFHNFSSVHHPTNPYRYQLSYTSYLNGLW